MTNGTADVAVHHAVLGEQVLEALPRGAHALIMTHDHAEDFALCDTALRLPALGSIGLIGSAANAEPGHSTSATTNRAQRPHRVSYWLKAWRVMDISVGGVPPM